MNAACAITLKERDAGSPVLAALNNLLAQDALLLTIDANERSIAYRLAMYLQAQLPDLHVDCEYNRDGIDPKRIQHLGLYPDDEDTEARTAFPDIIAHKRGTGTGKSTLAKLMLGFYEPTAGGIRIDGIDIRHMAANELRAYFGVVPQETVLFSGTVYANLVAANAGVSFQQVVQACKMAGVHDVIEALPQGYQTEVGERGAGLSGGQKQRLAIARALLKGPKVLIFDEATSALDSDTAESFARTVNGLKGKVTMLFITHALPKALKIDEVLHIGKEGVQQLKTVPTSGISPLEATH